MPSEKHGEAAERIPLSVPELGAPEIAALRECIESGWVSSVGPYVERFEATVARAVGAEHAVATSSGTAALHVALLLVGVQPDDEVVVPTLTFIAPANAVRYVGAWPVFVDVEPRQAQMDAARLAEFLDTRCRRSGGELRNLRTGRRVRAILPVHVLGHPVDMDPVLALARRYELPVVEDATESLGSRYRGRSVGTFGDVACFSFNGNKIVTTGGGGMIVTNDEEAARRARYLTTQAKDDPVEYVHHEVGFNYRLTSIQAAVGLAQMERLPGHVSARRRIAATYARELSGIPGLEWFGEAPGAESVFWLSTARLDRTMLGVSSRGLMADLAAAQIEARPLWQPLHRSPAHAGAEVVGGAVAEAVHRDALSLPSSAGLKPEHQARVIEEIRRALSRGTAARSVPALAGPAAAEE
jgi:perosamine synthetase